MEFAHLNCTITDDEYFIRLFLLIKRVATPLCRDLLHTFHPRDPAQFYTCMKSYEKILQPMLFPEQKDSLFGSPDKVTDSSEFDLTLLMMLLRKTCPGLPVPKSGWSRRPSLADVSTGAMLVRLRDFRNSLSHQGSGCLIYSDFLVKWKELSGILIRLGALQPDIDLYFSGPLDSASAKYDLVKEEVSILHDVLYQHIDVSFTKLSENEDKISSLHAEICKLQAQHQLLQRTPSSFLSAYEPSVADISERLRRNYAKSECLVSLLDWDQNNRSCLRLQEIYVPQMLEPWQSRRSVSDVEVHGDFRYVVEQSRKPLSLCIVADPGRGKTTLLRKIVLDYCESAAEWFSELCFEMAFYVVVEELTLYESLDEYLTERIIGIDRQYADTVKMFLEANSKKCLFLVDSLDSCGDGAKLYKDLHMLLKGLYCPGCAVVAATRPTGLDTIEKHLSYFNGLYTIPAFSVADIEMYIGKYYVEKDKLFCTDLHDLIISDPPMLALASNPLALTILCSLYENSDLLPHSAASLYHQLVYQMIQQFKTRIGAHCGLFGKRRVSHAVIKSMGHVAFTSLASGKEFFEQDDLVDYFVEKKRKSFFRKKSMSSIDASSILQLGFISADCGSNPRKLNWRYQFEPKLCQSYMAAEHIAETLIKHGIKGVRKLFALAGPQQSDPLDSLKKNEELCQFVIESLGRRGEKKLCKQLFNEMF